MFRASTILGQRSPQASARYMRQTLRQLVANSSPKHRFSPSSGEGDHPLRDLAPKARNVFTHPRRRSSSPLNRGWSGSDDGRSDFGQRRLSPKRRNASSVDSNRRRDVGFSDGTLGGLMRRWRGIFTQGGVPEAELSVEAIVAHVFSKKMFHELGSSIKTYVLSGKETEDIETLCRKRLKRMPIQYIIGEWDFRDINLKIKSPVFIPRPETEEFIDIITDHYRKDEALSFLEVGCGSGAIAISVLRSLSESRVTAFDSLAEAVQLTTENSIRCGVQDRLEVYQEPVTSEVPEKLEGSPLRFDAIVSNPPYIFHRDLQGLEPEVIEYEDSAALDGGRDGTDVIHDIIEVSPHLLKPGGYVWLETEVRHPEMVKGWLESRRDIPVRFIRSFPDFTGRPRFCQLQYEG